MTDLRECPFCGSQVTRLNDANYYYCPGCKVSVAWLQTGIGETDLLWNTRPTRQDSDSQEVKADALKLALKNCADELMRLRDLLHMVRDGVDTKRADATFVEAYKLLDEAPTASTAGVRRRSPCSPSAGA